LSRWGIIERAVGSSDGRERPWQAPATSLVISSQSTGAGRLASQAMMRSNIDRVMEQFEEMPGDDPWDGVSSMNRSRLWLTKTETEQLNQDLTEVINRYRRGRTAASHPADTRQVSTLLAIIPTGKPPAED
jgi:hypothetical protein